MPPEIPESDYSVLDVYRQMDDLWHHLGLEKDLVFKSGDSVVGEIQIGSDLKGTYHTDSCYYEVKGKVPSAIDGLVSVYNLSVYEGPDSKLVADGRTIGTDVSIHIAGLDIYAAYLGAHEGTGINQVSVRKEPAKDKKDMVARITIKSRFTGRERDLLILCSVMLCRLDESLSITTL